MEHARSPDFAIATNYATLTRGTRGPETKAERMVRRRSEVA
jgi:hypothetical protein